MPVNTRRGSARRGISTTKTAREDDDDAKLKVRKNVSTAKLDDDIFTTTTKHRRRQQQQQLSRRRESRDEDEEYYEEEEEEEEDASLRIDDEYNDDVQTRGSRRHQRRRGEKRDDDDDEIEEEEDDDDEEREKDLRGTRGRRTTAATQREPFLFGIPIRATTTTTTTTTTTSAGAPQRRRRNSFRDGKSGGQQQRYISWGKIMRNVAPFCVLSVQYGAQPLLTKKFISTKVSSLGVVAATECVKIVLCLISMRMQGPREIRRQFGKVRLNVFALSVVPAVVYSIQNMLMQYGYHSVDAVLFNCLNQTKIVWTALFVYVVFGTKQTFVQCLSLLGLMLASVILQIKEILEPAVDAQKSFGSMDGANGGNANGMTVIEEEEYARYLGVIAVTAASCLSGLASTSTQISLQALRRPAQVLTIEMAIASIPIVYFVHVSKLAFNDEVSVQQTHSHLQEGQDAAAAMTASDPLLARDPSNDYLVSSTAVRRLLYAGSTEWSSMFDHFTLLTFVPIFTSAVGGICVGLVTKNLGSVAKGFAITLGLILTGIIESITRGEMLQTEQIIGLLLVGVCTHAHGVYAQPEPPLTNSEIRLAAAAAERREEKRHREMLRANKLL
jgi:UDP-sugar transporter A1/2/3